VNVGQLEQAQMERDEDRRATWLETRNLEENFKELVYLSMQEVHYCCCLFVRSKTSQNKLCGPVKGSGFI